MKTIVVGIAGGSGSGKSTLADKLKNFFGDSLVVIRHDYYYKNRPDLSLEQRAALNYDIPEALETALLIKHLQCLKRGESIVAPDYDFESHLRKEQGALLAPAEIIVVEGILTLENEALRNMLDLKLFVDTDAALMASRRIERDCQTRGRTPESCVKQYNETVKPMLEKYILPSKQYADMVVSGNGDDDSLITIITRIKQITK